MSKPAHEANYFQSFWAMLVVRKRCDIVSICCVSQHQHLETMLILILLKLSYVAIIPFHALHKKKLILKDKLYIQIISYVSSFSFFFLIKSQADLTEKEPFELPIHQGLS